MSSTNEYKKLRDKFRVFPGLDETMAFFAPLVAQTNLPVDTQYQLNFVS